MLAGIPMPTCLAHLSPAALTSLQLEWGPPLSQTTLAALASFTALANLGLYSDAPLPPNTPTVLAQLSRLTAWELGGQVVRPELLAVLARLPALEDLTCHAHSSLLPPPGVELLAAEHLHPGRRRSTDLFHVFACCLVLPTAGPLSALTQLTALRWKEWRRPALTVARPDLQRLLTQLPRLNSWDVSSSYAEPWSTWDGCMWVS